MKKSKLFYALFLISLLTLSLVSCSNEEENEFINSVDTLPTHITFEDINLKGGEIAGELKWQKPLNTTDISSIVIYASNDGTSKEIKIEDVSVDVEKYTIESRDYTKYLILVPKSKKGIEGSEFVKIEVKDEIGNNVVTNLTFDDTDYTKGKVAGELKWTKPSGHINLSKLIVYTSEDGVTMKDKLTEIKPDVEKYAVENLNLIKFLLIVAVDSENKEVEDFAKIEIKDAYMTSGIYILNSGKMGNNNAGISLYNQETGTVNSKIFEEKNGIRLGDTGQDAIIYGSKMYIAVYGSGLIYTTDLNGKILGTIESEKGGKKQQPRGLTAYKGKVYATLFDGYLAKIDTTKLEIEAQVAVGRNPEHVRGANDKLYVANSGGLDYNTPLGYDKTVSVIDVPTFKETEKLDVVINPDKLAVDSEGDIYVISNGNYKDIQNTLQRIDATTHTVTKVGNASYMSMNNDKLYIIYSQYDANWNQTISYSIFDAKTEKIVANNFITDGTKIDKPYSLNVDPINNNIYVGASDYTNNGDMYIFSEGGKLIEKIDTKGINPQVAFSVNWITRQ